MLVTSRKKNPQRDDNAFFPRWIRQIKYAWQNVFNDCKQHIFATLLTIIVIAISIVLPTISYLLWKNANEAAHQWYPTPNLTVYLDKSLTQQETDTLVSNIKQYPEVADVVYLSREQTLEEFKLWSGFSEAIDLLDENPLPAVAIVIPKEEAKQSAILHAMQTEIVQLKGVSDVRLDDSWFTRLTALTDMVKAIAWTIAIFMMIAVSLVIGNSIRLAIFARRQTIIVMQLIGATEGFILRPFLYSGMFNGFVSAVVALILSEIFIFQIEAIILNVSSVFGTIFTIDGLNWDEALFIVLLSTIIGWLSALVATKKYLKMTHIA
ncbi:cell division transport system permease protein [Orbus hercynius]|uniref:Cell division protein FtsX n=1 Tax=Orbus hercynius TaxID=593135 RepID=A0A495RF86_9GAMM|nr:permease-like cell division protein FtsX [Orbus hercynius]RKS85876.1 cell division transport system permease protein [Orbus hercynius]